MKLTKKEVRSARTYLRRASVCVMAAAVAATMCVPATALALNGTPSASAYYGLGKSYADGVDNYGCGPDKAIGTDTVPVVGKDSLYSYPFFDSQGKRYLTAACGGLVTGIIDFADIVGLDSLSASSYNWGTKINANPDPFAWNDFLYTNQDDVTCKSVRGDAASPTLGIGYVKTGPTGVATYATVDKYRPDVLCNSSMDTYKTIVASINESDGNTNYSPKYATINTGSLISLVDSLWAEADAAESVLAADPNTTTRYGSPYQIAENFENMTLALQWYILSQHEQQGTLAKVAYISGYADGTATAVAVDPASEGSSTSRLYEGFEQITQNIVLGNSSWTNTSGTNYTSSNINSLKNCDVVFVNISDGTARANFEEALDAVGYKGKVCDNINLSVSNAGFGGSRNLLEFMSYLYPDDVKLAYTIRYWWSNFGHIKDEYLDAIMVATESSCLLPTGNAATDLDTTGYTEDYLNARFAKGISYYQQHKNDSSSYCTHYRLNASGSANAVNNYQATPTFNLVAADVDGDAVTAEGVTLTEGVDYTVEGKAITGMGGFEGSIKLAAEDQSVSVSTSKLSIKAGKTANIKASAKTAVTFAKKSGNAKITVSKKGVVKVAKTLKKGTYTIKVKASAAATDDYNAASKTASIKVTVK